MWQGDDDEIQDGACTVKRIYSLALAEGGAAQNHRKRRCLFWNAEVNPARISETDFAEWQPRITDLDKLTISATLREGMCFNTSKRNMPAVLPQFKHTMGIPRSLKCTAPLHLSLRGESSSKKAFMSRMNFK